MSVCLSGLGESFLKRFRTGRKGVETAGPATSPLPHITQPLSGHVSCPLPTSCHRFSSTEGHLPSPQFASNDNLPVALALPLGENLKFLPQRSRAGLLPAHLMDVPLPRSPPVASAAVGVGGQDSAPAAPQPPDPAVWPLLQPEHEVEPGTSEGAFLPPLARPSRWPGKEKTQATIR